MFIFKRSPIILCLLSIFSSEKNLNTVSNLSKIQESYWLALESNNSRKADKLYNQIEGYMKSDNYTEPELVINKDKRLGSGGAKRYKVTFRSGVTAIFKPIPELGGKYNHIREYCSYKIDHLLHINMIPYTTIRTIKISDVEYTGSLQLWIDEAISAEKKKFSDDQQPEKLRFLDLLIGNDDRWENRENWMFLKSGRIIAVDNDSTFKYYVGEPYFYLRQMMRLRKGKINEIEGYIKKLNNIDSDKWAEELSKLKQILSHKGLGFSNKLDEFLNIRKVVIDSLLN